MADNSLFTVFTALFSGTFGASLTYLFNFLSEKRRIKFDKAKENRAEKKILDEKFIIIMLNIKKYYVFMVSFNKEFKDDFYQNPSACEKALSLFHKVNTIKKIEILEDDFYKIFQITDFDTVGTYNNLIHHINHTINDVNLYNAEITSFGKTEDDFEYIPQYYLDQFLDEQEETILRILKLGGKIFNSSLKNIEDIKKILLILINSEKFLSKNIKIELPKIDGGFETIKRTVP